jgi:hypothetical protein
MAHMVSIGAWPCAWYNDLYGCWVGKGRGAVVLSGESREWGRGAGRWFRLLFCARGRGVVMFCYHRDSLDPQAGCPQDKTRDYLDPPYERTQWPNC